MVSSRDASEHASKKVQEKGTAALFNATAPFPPLPGKRPELEVRTRTRNRACTQVHERIYSGRTASGPRSDEKRCTKGRGPLRASLPNSRKERIDDGDSVQNVPSSIFTAFTERTQIRILFMNSKLPLWRFFSISKTEYWVERSDFRPGFDFH